MSQQRYAALLRDLAHCGVYHTPPTGMPDLLAAADKSGFAIFCVDLSAARDKSALFERLAAALEFPAWFGHNWDALADCLGDLSWRPADGYLILLEHCDGIRANQSADFATALQVFAAASDAWRDERVPFWVLVDMQTDGIAYLPELD